MTKLFVNIDTDDCGCNFLNLIASQKSSFEEKDLYPFIDQYLGSGVTDILICLGGQYSFAESRVLSDAIFKYEQRIENGFPVDYREKFNGVYLAYKKYAIDPVSVWVDRCREVGLTPHLSFRMNDRHCSRDDTSNQRPTLFYEAMKNGWMLGDRYGAYKTCMNFAVPDIRRVWLDFIDEQLSKYDVSGIELDFQREIHCLRYLDEPDCHEIMTEFIREIRRRVDLHAKQRGHKISICCRLMRDIHQNLIFGFDAVTWEREKLVDMIVVAPRWECCDSDMPIKEWKDTLPTTEIYAGLESLIRFDGSLYHATPETLRGYTNRYLSDCADGMYLFNYYPVPGDETARGKRHFERCREIFTTCADKKGAQSRFMRYIVTRQDIYPEGYKPYSPLPIKLDGGEMSLNVSVGSLSDNHRVFLTVGFDGAAPQDVIVRANGRILSDPIEYTPRAEEFRTDKCGCGYVPTGSKTFRFNVDTIIDGNYPLSFEGSNGSVTYVEFEIEPSTLQS